MIGLIIANITQDAKIIKVTTELKGVEIRAEVEDATYLISISLPSSPKSEGKSVDQKSAVKPEHKVTAVLAQSYNSDRALIPQVRYEPPETTGTAGVVEVEFSNGNIAIPTNFWLCVYLDHTKPPLPSPNSLRI